MAYCNLDQINRISNANNIFVDLIFSNCIVNVGCACDILVTCDSHHPALYLEHNLCDTVPYENNDITILDFKNCVYETIFN